MIKDDRLYLIHISECLARIEAYTVGGEAQFLADSKTQDAVLRNLQVMSESTQHLSPEIKATQPQVSWQGLAGFRNILVHNYLGVNLARVWKMVEHDLPVLKHAIEQMLQEIQKPEKECCE